MISKELLSEVLDREITVIANQGGTSIFNYRTSESPNHINSINIYELAHKCKEWAFKNDYEIETTYSGDVRISKNSTSMIVNSQLGLEDMTEPEAIFKACEWILEQRNG